MARIVMTWELGGGTGHLHILAPLIKGLLARGHQVDLITRDLIKAGKLFGNIPVKLYPAPIWTGKATGQPDTINYGDILLRTGYLDPEGMAVLMKSWLSFFQTLKPDIIIAEHSPTAVLAARVAGISCGIIGFGFTLPKAADPFPSITPWKAVSGEQLQARTNQALRQCNRVLELCGGDPLERLSDLLDVRFQALLTFPELDHYGPRKGVGYYGSFMFRDSMPGPVWPKGAGPQIFVYYHHGYQQFPVLMKELQAMDYPALVVSPGISRELASKYAGKRLTITSQQVDLESVAQEADVIFSHSPHGLLCELLRLGRASISLPYFVEQAQLAYRVQQQGLGKMADLGSRQLKCREMADSLLEDSAMADRASEFRERYRNYNQDTAVVTLLDRLEAAISGNER